MSGRAAVPEPHDSAMLEVGQDQHLCWGTVGAPEGLPAVFLHGGPGSGCPRSARRTFDPARFRGVLFGQRGCGRSRPLATEPDYDLSANTTTHLLADIERLREFLGVDAVRRPGYSRPARSCKQARPVGVPKWSTTPTTNNPFPAVQPAYAPPC